jgi:hypothetical protein
MLPDVARIDDTTISLVYLGRAGIERLSVLAQPLNPIQDENRQRS